MVVQGVALLDFRHGGFVADFSEAAFEQAIHECGFSDVGDAHDQHAKRLAGAVTMRGEELAETGHFGGLAGLVTGEGDGVDVRFPVEFGQPGLSDGGVGEIAFVEHLQTGSLAVQP